MKRYFLIAFFISFATYDYAGDYDYFTIDLGTKYRSIAVDDIQKLVFSNGIVNIVTDNWRNVYGIGGNLLKETDSIEEKTALSSLPQGIYVIKPNGKTSKIVK